MAVMIPTSGPRKFDEKSKEGLLYYSLAKLPDDYYVVHSLEVVSTAGGEFRENEADFVVFNAKLGLLCIEAKAGRASYSGGEWHYANGRPMAYGSPYRQAENMMYRLRACFEERGLGNALDHCKTLSAVWFPSLRRRDLAGGCLSPEASLDLTLFADDLKDPEPRIRSIFSLKVGGKTTTLSDAQAKAVVSRVICPEFEILPTKRTGYDLADMAFVRLLDSQARVLDFIVDQRSAVINGAAGTGKTLIAIERARRAAAQGDRVLFLCFNAMLKEDVKSRLEGEQGIDVYSIAGFAYKVAGALDYDALAEWLLERADGGDFPYQHVVIDEGQDFGIADIDRACVLDMLRGAVLAQERGTFYLFYDKNQFVQGSKIPSVIDEADCKLTLYVNCRNTQNIARCSCRAIRVDDAKVKTIGNAFSNNPPRLVATRDVEQQARYVDAQLEELQGSGLKDIVILTCRTEERSSLRGHLRVIGDDYKWERGSVPFTTCRKFKGLEAEAVILVDVDASLWEEPQADYEPDPGLLFYTGASRARHELRIVCDMDEDGCVRTLELMDERPGRKPAKRLASKLCALLEQV